MSQTVSFTNGHPDQVSHLQTVLNNVTEGIVVADLAGRLNYWNPAALAMHGFANMDECLRNLNDVIVNFELSHLDGAILPLEDWPISRILRGDELRNLQIRVKRLRSDDERIFNYGGSLVRDAAGQPLMAVVTVSDITEQHQAETALRRYRLLAGHSRDIILFMRSEDGRILEANAAAEETYGYSREELLGFTIHHLRAQDESGAVIQQMITADAQGILFETLHRRKDGSIFPAEVSSRGATIDGQRTLISIVRDITERKKTELALRESEQRERQRAVELETVLQTVPVTVWIAYDPDCHHITGNRMADELLRLPYGAEASLTAPGERRPTHFKSIKDGRILSGDELPVQRAARGQASSDFEFSLEFDDGTVRHLLGNSVPLLDDQNQSRGTVSAFVDISERKRIEEQLTHALELLKFHVENSPLAVIEWGPDFRLSRWNAEAERIFGWRAEEVIGKQMTDFRWIYEDDQQQIERVSTGLLNGTAPSSFSANRNYRKDGSIAHCEWYNSSQVDASGKLISILSLVLDITDRKQTEEALRLRNERLTLLSESAMHLLKAENPETMVLELFEKVSRHLQLDAYLNFMVNESGDALHLESCAGIPDEIAQSIQHLDFGVAVCGAVALTRQPIHASFIQDSSDPKVQLIKAFGIRACACNPLMTGKRLLGTLSFATRNRDQFTTDELEFLRTICRYVAMAKERIRLEKELRQHIGQLAEADHRKNEFLAMLAHELRNPLAPIRNAAGVLQLMASHDTKLQRQREIIERQVTHMARLLDDLLDVSRITRGKIHLKKQSLTLNRVLSHAVETAMPLIESRRHTLTLDLPEENIFLEADPDRLAQVIGNLLSNAAKYTDEDGRLWLHARRLDREAIISVRDTGIGIAPQMLPQVFDLFAQADHSLARSQGGLGIGLTMVHKLVEMHGGAVEARSAGLGQGSEFIVRLPALPTAFADTPAADCACAPPPREDKKLRILIVDDMVDSATSLAELLSLWGHDVQVAFDGPAAIQAAQAGQPQLVLLDIGLPGMDGYQVASHLRQLPAGAAITLVAMTGYGQDRDRHAAGFNRHMTKPLDLDELEHLLNSLR